MQGCWPSLNLWSLASLRPCLELDAGFSLTAAEALQHPWLLPPAEQLDLALLVLPTVQVTQLLFVVTSTQALIANTMHRLCLLHKRCDLTGSMPKTRL